MYAQRQFDLSKSKPRLKPVKGQQEYDTARGCLTIPVPLLYIDTMFKRLSLFFVSLLLLFTLVEAFHHHDDGADHPDCSICVATHQQAETGYTPPALEIHRNFTETAYLRPVSAVIPHTFFTPANNRAPPA